MRTLYHNGRLWTMDPLLPEAESMVVDEDRILAVGARHEVEGLLGPGDRTVDLNQHLVVPGLIDAHVHFSWFSFGLRDVNLEQAATLAEALERIRYRVQGAAPGMWIRGSGFNANVWERWPTCYDLDSVAPHNPVVISSKDYHSTWANSLALRLAGITPQTADPPGGYMFRDEHGALTGILQENAGHLIWPAVPPRLEEEYAEAIRIGLQRAHEVGVTSVHDMDPVDCFRALQRLQFRGELSVRFFKQIPEPALAHVIESGMKTGFGNDWLRVGCLKLFSDGSLGSQSAHMLEPFEGQPANFGVPTHTPEELERLISMAVQNDIAVAVHAIGDAANRVVLDAFERVAEVSRQKSLRHRIEHAQLLTEADIPRFGELGVIASVQPSHAPSDRYIADRFWGARSRLAYAFSSLLKAGARLAMGSDVPVEPLDPLAGIHAAVWRKRLSEPESLPWYPEERLTVEQVVHGFTLGAAYAAGEEHIKGSLSPGKLADFVVLTHDIRNGSEEVLRLVRPQATVIGGRVLFGGV